MHSARRSVSRSARLASATAFLTRHGGAFITPGHVLLPHSGVEQLHHAVHLAHAVDHRVDEAAGALAARRQVLGQRHGGLEVARHEGVGEVVDLGRGLAGHEALHLLGVQRVARVGGDGELLQLARQALLAGTGQRHERLGGLRAELQAQLRVPGRPPSAAAPMASGAACSRTSPPAASTAFASAFSGFPCTISTRTVSGGMAPIAAISGSSAGAFQAAASSASR